MARLILSLTLCIAVIVPAFGADAPKELEQLKAGFKGDSADESLRSHYILNLAQLRRKYIAAGKIDDAFAVDAEIKKRPLPPDADAQALKKLIVGKWHTIRHDYMDRPDGTWSMIPLEDGIAHGHWTIKGNHYSYTNTYTEPAETKSGDYTIILLDADNFIFTDGDLVFYEKRFN